MIQLIKKSHKLIDIISVYIFLFCLMSFLLLKILNNVVTNIPLLLGLTFFIASLISKLMVNKVNDFIHHKLNLKI
jgi:c-di-AMP phosphodiesterase-like protein